MGNKGATGPFAPLVVAIRNVYGTKNFNLLRGKAISLHSQGKGHRTRVDIKKRRKGTVADRNARRRWVLGGAEDARKRNQRQRRKFAIAPSSTSFSPSNLFSLFSSSLKSKKTVIKEFGKSIGVDTKQVQGLIRLAKKNGEKLGFLA